MNDQTKKIVLAVVVVVAVIVAVVGALKMTGGEKMTVEKTVTAPAGFKSEKQAALDGKAGGAPAPERDLSK